MYNFSLLCKTQDVCTITWRFLKCTGAITWWGNCKIITYNILKVYLWTKCTLIQYNFCLLAQWWCPPWQSCYDQNETRWKRKVWLQCKGNSTSLPFMSIKIIFWHLWFITNLIFFKGWIRSEDASNSVQGSSRNPCKLSKTKLGSNIYVSWNMYSKL